MKSLQDSSRLCSVADKTHLLTLSLDLDTLAEFAVSSKVFRARSVSSYLHQYVVSQINAAKREVSADEWKRLVLTQKEATIARSEAKLRTSPLKREQLVNEKISGKRLAPNASRAIPKKRPVNKEGKKRRTG